MQVLQNIQALQYLQKSDLPKRTLREIFPIFEQYIPKNDNIAIAVSSGVDSMCLASLLIFRFQQNKFPLSNIHIIHCNHKLRAQSEEEEQYVKQFFEGVNIHIFHRDTKEKADEKSLRNRRYQCFSQTLEQENISLLFLGHHLEDRIESTFLNTIRGAGLKGFLNMKIIQKHQLLSNGEICRPLLYISKREIIDFCKSCKIGFFEDETNSDISTSQRNYIRKEILGKLIENNGKPTKFLESMKNIYQQIEFTPFYKGGSELNEQGDFENNENTSPLSGGEGAKRKRGLKPIPNFPSRKSEFSYLWEKETNTCTKEDILELWDNLGIYYDITNSKIQERYQRITQTQSGRKELKNIYFFFHEKKLYIIKVSPLPCPVQATGIRGDDPLKRVRGDWRKQHINEEKIISKLGPQTIAGITIDASEERFLGTTLRFPKPGDTFNGKTRNRRCLNQKIPVFWRNFIPLAVKDGNVIHMRKNIWK